MSICSRGWLQGILISLLFHLPELEMLDLLFSSLITYCQQTLALSFVISRRQGYGPIPLFHLASAVQEVPRAHSWAISPALWSAQSQGQGEYMVLSGHWQRFPNGHEKGLGWSRGTSVPWLSLLRSSFLDHWSLPPPVRPVLSKLLSQS